jgi:crotonobetainyl-CoA:carnitine CoA-transferase CaiB-like acyl-CoA transferase
MMALAQHRSFGGRYWRHAPLIKFSQTPGSAGAFCEAGEHTKAVLTELGYDRAAMMQLKDEGVVAWPVSTPRWQLAVNDDQLKRAL